MGRWANKYVIGLTGNIAMGKSVVRKMLENLGAYTIDADGLAHQAMAPGAPTYAPIVENFGKWILDAEKKIDRNKLGAVVFSHNDALNLLEKLTHPVVGQAIDILISRAKQPIIVVEAIKMVDGVLGGQVDSIWVVDATPETQLQRLMTRRSVPEYEARKRIDTQNPQVEKLAKANVIIRNNGSPEEVWTQVQAEWQKMFRPAAAPATPSPAPVTVSPTIHAAPPTPPPTAVSAPTQPIPPPPQRQPSPAPQPVATSAAVPVARPPIPAAPISKPIVTPAAQANAPTAVEIRRGSPKNADAIARLLSQANNRQVTRNDIMLAFGEKSYILAEGGGRLIGLAGFQVENLITRMDEFYVIPDVPLETAAGPLISAVEDASRELQSEVGFIFMPRTAPPTLLQTFYAHHYERIEIETLKVPAWREAAQEMQSPERLILMKKLRAERVLKPV